MAGQGEQSKLTIHGRGVAYGLATQDAIKVEDADGNIKMRLKFDGTLEADLEAAVEVRNESGSTIDAGDLVSVTSLDATTQRPLIQIADADASAGDEQVADYVIRADIANNANGVAYKTYREGTLNTNAGSVGDPVYLGTTAGDWTLTRPTGADDVVQVVGRIAVVSATVGVIEFDLTLLGGLEEIGTDNIQDGAVTQGKLQEGSMRFFDKQLTNTDAKALATGSGIEIVAAPGANKAIVVHKILLVADAAAGAWVEPSAPDDLVVQYNGGADITAAIEAGVMVAADVSVRTYGVLDTELTPETNVAVNLFNTGSNWTGGNAANTISLRTFYSVIDTIAFT